jgi:hypothetical protein
MVLLTLLLSLLILGYLAAHYGTDSRDDLRSL